MLLGHAQGEPLILVRRGGELFAIGAVAGSWAWFLGLGYGARTLRPVFSRPGAWRVLDAGIAVVMLVIAVSLVRHA